VSATCSTGTINWWPAVLSRAQLFISVRMRYYRSVVCSDRIAEIPEQGLHGVFSIRHL